MTDREKVINGLEHCIGDNCNGDNWGECEYSRHGCIDALLEDTLVLLKAQQPIAPVKVNRYMETDENGDWFSPETYDCGNCGVELHGKANYCHLCGRAVKWE